MSVISLFPMCAFIQWNCSAGILLFFAQVASRQSRWKSEQCATHENWSHQRCINAKCKQLNSNHGFCTAESKSARRMWTCENALSQKFRWMAIKVSSRIILCVCYKRCRRQFLSLFVARECVRVFFSSVFQFSSVSRPSVLNTNNFTIHITISRICVCALFIWFEQMFEITEVQRIYQIIFSEMGVKIGFYDFSFECTCVCVCVVVAFIWRVNNFWCWM